VLNSCRLRGVPVDRLTVEMAYDEVPGPLRVGALSAAISMEPEPPDETKRRVIGVARHATLSNTLLRPPEMDIRFAEQEQQS
jgi:hypothetical protein